MYPNSLLTTIVGMWSLYAYPSSKKIAQKNTLNLEPFFIQIINNNNKFSALHLRIINFGDKGTFSSPYHIETWAKIFFFDFDRLAGFDRICQNCFSYKFLSVGDVADISDIVGDSGGVCAGELGGL